MARLATKTAMEIRTALTSWMVLNGAHESMRAGLWAVALREQSLRQAVRAMSGQGPMCAICARSVCPRGKLCAAGFSKRLGGALWGVRFFPDFSGFFREVVPRYAGGTNSSKHCTCWGFPGFSGFFRIFPDLRPRAPQTAACAPSGFDRVSRRGL